MGEVNLQQSLEKVCLELGVDLQEGLVVRTDEPAISTESEGLERVEQSRHREHCATLLG